MTPSRNMRLCHFGQPSLISCSSTSNLLSLRARLARCAMSGQLLFSNEHE